MKAGRYVMMGLLSPTWRRTTKGRAHTCDEESRFLRGMDGLNGGCCSVSIARCFVTGKKNKTMVGEKRK